MIVIGVTGNTGSGKSTVSTIIKNNTGALVIDADKVVKELMVSGNEYYEETVKLFGEVIVNKEKQKIDNKKLAKIIFEDEEKREKLNKLTFKYIGKRTKELILENKEKEVVVLDFPLLYEGKFDKICNCVIAVVSDEETKISRIKERDRITKEAAKKRLGAQIDEEELKKKADYIVDNSNNVKYFSLVKNVVNLVHKIKRDVEEKKNK